MKISISIESKRTIDDRTGRALLTFTPVFHPDVTAEGELRFASWQVWEDEPQDIKEAKNKALRNALTCMKRFSAIL